MALFGNKKIKSPPIHVPDENTPPYAYGIGEEFHPGAGLAAYLKTMLDPLQNIEGAGFETLATLDVLPAPPIYIPSPMSIVYGLQDELGTFHDFGLSGTEDD